MESKFKARINLWGRLARRTRIVHKTFWLLLVWYEFESPNVVCDLKRCLSTCIHSHPDQSECLDFVNIRYFRIFPTVEYLMTKLAHGGIFNLAGLFLV